MNVLLALNRSCGDLFVKPRELRLQLIYRVVVECRKSWGVRKAYEVLFYSLGADWTQVRSITIHDELEDWNIDDLLGRGYNLEEVVL